MVGWVVRKYVQPCLQLHSCTPCCLLPALALATRASRRHAHATARILAWVTASGPPGVLLLSLLLTTAMRPKLVLIRFRVWWSLGPARL